MLAVPGPAAVGAWDASGGAFGAGDDGPVEIADADVAQVQPGGELGDRGVQQPVDVGGGFQVLAEAGQDLIRLVPPAVDHAGHAALQLVAQRDQRQRGQRRRQRRRPPGVMIGHQRGDGDHHRRVDADDSGGHGQPQQRAMGRAAKVIQAVVQDRDRDRGRQRQQHHAEDPAGNAIGDQYGEKDQRGRPGGQGQQQQLLPDQRTSAPPPGDEPGDGSGGGAHREQNPGGAERAGDVPVADRQAERAVPVGQPVLV